MVSDLLNMEFCDSQTGSKNKKRMAGYSSGEMAWLSRGGDVG